MSFSALKNVDHEPTFFFCCLSESSKHLFLKGYFCWVDRFLLATIRTNFSSICSTILKLVSRVYHSAALIILQSQVDIDRSYQLSFSITWCIHAHGKFPYASIYHMHFYLLQVFDWNRDNNRFISLICMGTMNKIFKSSWQMSRAIDLVSYNVVWHTVRSIIVKTELSHLYRPPEKSLGIVVQWDVLTYDTRINGIVYSVFMLASSGIISVRLLEKARGSLCSKAETEASAEEKHRSSHGEGPSVRIYCHWMFRLLVYEKLMESPVTTCSSPYD